MNSAIDLEPERKEHACGFCSEFCREGAWEHRLVTGEDPRVLTSCYRCGAMLQTTARFVAGYAPALTAPYRKENTYERLS